MKKNIFLLILVTIIISCAPSAKKKSEVLQHKRDSLRMDSIVKVVTGSTKNDNIDKKKELQAWSSINFNNTEDVVNYKIHNDSNIFKDKKGNYYILIGKSKYIIDDKDHSRFTFQYNDYHSLQSMLLMSEDFKPSQYNTEIKRRWEEFVELFNKEYGKCFMSDFPKMNDFFEKRFSYPEWVYGKKKITLGMAFVDGTFDIQVNIDYKL